MILVTPDTIRSWIRIWAPLFIWMLAICLKIVPKLFILKLSVWCAWRAINLRVQQKLPRCDAQLALSLSDAWCVKRHFATYRIRKKSCLYSFRNEDEIISLGKTDTHGSIVRVSNWVDELIVTKSEAGANIFTEDEQVSVPAMPSSIVDTTGAGDLFASGYLFGRVTASHQFWNLQN